MSTMLGYPTFKGALVGLINAANDAYLPQSFTSDDLTLTQTGYETSSQVATLEITAPNSRYFGNAKEQYSKWDFERYFLGITVPVKPAAGTTVADALTAFCLAYSLPPFVPEDFEDASFLTQLVNYDEGSFSLSQPFSAASLGWAGTLNLTFGNSLPALADYVKVTTAKFQYPDPPETGKKSIRLLTRTMDFTALADKLGPAAGAGNVLPVDVIPSLVEMILDAAGYQGGDRGTLDTDLVQGLTNAAIATFSMVGGPDGPYQYEIPLNVNPSFFGTAVITFVYSEE